VAVVVTYNRRELLRQCLSALAAQSCVPEHIVVVDNDSDDGTTDLLADHPAHPDVLTLSRNVGGAGGFAAGMAYALEVLHAEWVWVMDDDTIPTPGALEALIGAEADSRLRLSVLSSQAIWSDGRVHPMNQPRTRVRARPREVSNARGLGARPIRTASYVSALIRADDLRRLGLPNADYFIWSDDFEHTGRLLRDGYGVHVPASVVEHRTKAFGTAQQSPGDRFYFDVRNRVWALFNSTSFRVWERFLYGFSTSIGWVKQIIRHLHLLRPGAKGLLDALKARPRASSGVLAADPEVAQLVKKVEVRAGRWEPSQS
jgi:GT2 family glycosyltransferase